MAIRASSSSSSFSYGWTYDVFLSFRGEDTRHGFTGNLYKALHDKGIHTFMDAEELQRGKEITPSLVKAIEESRIAIAVLSKNYASSTFCLDELSKIIECIKRKVRLVLPIFYHIDPSDVRKQTGSYGEALAMHEEKFRDNKERLEKWKIALRQIANLSGWHIKPKDGYEYKFIGRIVEEISKKINRVPLHVADYPVGLEFEVLKVNWLLDVGSDDGVHMVGIHGIGGIGKTTVARAVYNLIADHFDGLCFLDNVRENSTKHGLVHLQEKLLSNIVGLNIKLGDVNEGIPIIKHRLYQKKVLLILDDVDKPKQLQVMVGRLDWFGSGSRVIITTRDKHLLASHGVERTYEVHGLNKKEAIKLLNWKAFKTEKVCPSYMDISNRVVTYASGLPLALEVIGSNLFGKSIEEWKSALDQYERIPNKEIQKILKVSFDALEEHEQSIFLDIACCFKGYELTKVEDILCAHHGVCMKYAIRVLVDKSLLKIEDHRVTLHDLIEDMGKEIVRQESPIEPGKRSRLWFHEDTIQVLEDNKGTSEIEIIFLDSPIFGKEVNWDGEALKKMINLKTLIIRKGRFSQGPKHLPNSLRVLEWWEYPSQSLPSDFRPKKLAIFNLPCSCLMSLELPEWKKLVNLKVLDFSNSKCITEIVDVSGVPNLEKLSFEDCENLIKIHKSVGFLDKLRILDADGCNKLRSFPPIKLTSLEILQLSYCSSLENFPVILGKMENITDLYLEGTPIKELPFSIQNLTRLRSLEVGRCGIVQLPSSIPMLPELERLTVWGCEELRSSKQVEGEDNVSSIVSSKTEYLILSNCNISDEFLQIGLAFFANLKELDLSRNSFTILPASIKECCFLRSLNLDYCESLREIRGIPPNLESFCARYCTYLEDLDLTLLPAGTKECHFLRKLLLDGCENLQEIRGVPPNIELLHARNCTSLTTWCRSMLLNEDLHEEARDKEICLPGARIPEWFEHRSRGQSISFWFRNKSPAISLCVVGGQLGKHFNPMLFINGNTQSVCSWEYRECLGDLECLEDHVHIFDQKQIKLIKKVGNRVWNHVKFFIGVKQLGVGVHVFKNKSSMEDIRFTNPYERDVDNVNWDSYLMVSTQIISTTNIQGTLRLDNEVSEPFCQASSKLLWNSDLTRSTLVSDAASDGDCSRSIKWTYLNRTSTSVEDVRFTKPNPLNNTCKDSWYSNDDMGNQLTLLDNGLCEAPDIHQRQQLALFNPTIPTGCETVEFTQEDRAMYHEINGWLSMLPCRGQPLDYVYCNSDPVESARTIYSTNDIGQAVLDHPEKAAAESSQAHGFAEMQNIQAPSPTSSIGNVSGESLLPTCCTVLPTKIDESFRNQIELTQDDVEMEAFYASLEAGTHVLSHSHEKLATTAPSEEAKEALKIVQNFISNDASVLLHPEQCSVMKTSLDYLSNLSANDGISGEMKTLVSEASRVFAHWSRDYLEASMKIESTTFELQRDGELETRLEDNKKKFGEVMALENELLGKLACMEESKKELEEQINALKANISASQSEKNMTRKRKRDIFEEGKTLKAQIDELREKVPLLQHEQGAAKKTQAKIKSEWSKLREKFKKIDVEWMYKI